VKFHRTVPIYLNFVERIIKDERIKDECLILENCLRVISNLS